MWIKHTNELLDLAVSFDKLRSERGNGVLRVLSPSPDKPDRGHKESLGGSGSKSTPAPSCGALTGAHCLFCEARCYGSHTVCGLLHPFLF